ncbi:MAG: cobalamin-dependent protein [Reyranella sp.]|uniref:B12-binding domain-containing radical SAM protein n=1 Tax=Reyranella sp. TaxID=1929291 RepID=UPI001AC9F74E|nr:cobalamin-dependent protein [Reyranella sp.]MBN9089180.1 cobalamin-dependent protein [Reyranella sp.]
MSSLTQTESASPGPVPAAGPLKVGLVQINNSFSGQNYLPYSIALLQTYVQKFAADPGLYEFLTPLYKRVRIADAVEALKGADLVGFSTYVWNGRISLEIARRLKALKPGIVIVFGGPHVPDQPEAFLRANPQIDLAVHNEGERTFLKLLEAWPDRDAWESVAGVSMVKADGSFVRNPNIDRVRDLDEIPSPFLEGVFDSIMAANPNESWIGLWETNRGCPFRCTFCDWGSATAGKVTKFGEERLFREVDWFAEKKIEYIFCCDANFGIQKRDVDIANYVADVKKTTGYPVALSVQNTKNATERAYLTQKILSDAGLNKGVALSMQSVDMPTLEAIKRDNISLGTYMELQRRFTKDKVETYSDLILGLPGETYESFVRGVDQLMENGQHNRIQFNNLSILPNAEMGDPAYQKKYGMVTVESKIINIHGERVELDDDVPEVQDLVIATASTPLADWRRTRIFCWMTALLHFDKLFQIPLILAHGISGITYRDMIEAFMHADAERYPLIAEINAFFESEARSIQRGGSEYVFSREYLNIYWPADEFIFVKLTADGKFDAFYAEAGKLLAETVTARHAGLPMDVIEDAIKLNHALVHQPFAKTNLAVKLRYDILDYWHKVRTGEQALLRTQPMLVEIDRTAKPYDDFQKWCREIVWWGNKKGAYLHSPTAKEITPELAGHY